MARLVIIVFLVFAVARLFHWIIFLILSALPFGPPAYALLLPFVFPAAT